MHHRAFERAFEDGQGHGSCAAYAAHGAAAQASRRAHAVQIGDELRCERHRDDDGESELPPLKAFIMPGGTPKAAALHVARTVCRRAERSVVRLQHTTDVPTIIIVYLNRLSDLLFVLARVANRRAGAGEVTW